MFKHLMSDDGACHLFNNVVMSGGEGKEMVASGRVTVDGLPETRKRRKIRVGQTIEFEGRVITVVQAS